MPPAPTLRRSVAPTLRRLFLLLPLLLPTPPRADTLPPPPATSLKNALAAVAAQYKSDTPDPVDFAFGSSGQLLAQAKAGAPIDLFISAAATQLDALDKANLLDPATRRTI